MRKLKHVCWTQTMQPAAPAKKPFVWGAPAATPAKTGGLGAKIPSVLSFGKTKAADGALIGVAGRKYGLQASPAVKGVFGADDDDSEAPVTQKTVMEAHNKARQKKQERELEDAMKQDASVFQYDEVYDDIDKAKTEKIEAKAAVKRDRAPKYIVDLLAKAEDRKKEQDIIHERKLLKDRETEDHLYEGKEKFITPSYVQTLKERSIYAAKLALKDAKDEDVTKKTDMSAMYANLLNKGMLSRSAVVDKEAQEAKEKAEREQSQPQTEPKKRRKWGEPREGEVGGSKEDEGDPSAKRAKTEQLGDSGAGSGSSAAAARAGAGAGAGAEETAEQKAEREEAERKAAEEKEAADKARREDAAKAARERYLARKAAKKAA